MVPTETIADPPNALLATKELDWTLTLPELATDIPPPDPLVVFSEKWVLETVNIPCELIAPPKLFAVFCWKTVFETVAVVPKFDAIAPPLIVRLLSSPSFPLSVNVESLTLRLKLVLIAPPDS